MTPSLIYLSLTLVFALAHILATAAAKRLQDDYKWALGNRDGAQPVYTGVAGRLERAEANLFASLPIFIRAVLVAHVSGRENHLTFWGAAIFFWARVAYAPIYAIGLSPWRSLAWGVGFVGLALTLIGLMPGIA